MHEHKQRWETSGIGLGKHQESPAGRVWEQVLQLGRWALPDALVRELHQLDGRVVFALELELVLEPLAAPVIERDLHNVVRDPDAAGCFGRACGFIIILR